MPQVFSEFSSEPVAAASLGQVYKAKLRPNTAFSPTLSSDDGDDGSTSSGNTEALEVAVKVQRPGITSSVALDMHLIRSAGPVIKAVFGLQSDVVGTVDDWGLGFGEWHARMRGRTVSKDAVSILLDMISLARHFVCLLHVSFERLSQCRNAKSLTASFFPS